MRGFVILGLASMLAAFAPPDRPPIPEPAQQALPKSWIPERKPDQTPPIGLDVAPRQPSAYRHRMDLACSPPTGPAASLRKFVEAYQGAKAAFETGRLQDAIEQLEIAAANAGSSREWVAIEMMRIEAFAKLGDDAELIASLEAVLSAEGCLPEDRLADYRRMLEAARARLPR